MKSIIKLLRPAHYVKNLLVFAALACSGQLFSSDRFGSAILGFVSFCLLSSVIYIINDICDADKDRKHPTKCNRPIASGAVKESHAWLLAVLLLTVCVLCNYFTFAGVWSFVLLLLYFFLNLSYSFGLKNIPILDLAILVSGFLLRVIYGGVITGIEISNWLNLTVIALAFYFSLGKRRNELRLSQHGQTRKVLHAYSIPFLEKSMTMCLTLAIVFYALWSMDANTVMAYGGNLVLTVPIAMLIVMKYNLNIEGESSGDPVDVLLHDKFLLILCAAFVVTLLTILYL